MIVPNVKLEPTKRGFRVLVAGQKMTGVISAEVVQATKEKVGPDGWRYLERQGEAEVVIRLPIRLVEFGPESIPDCNKPDEN